MIIYKIILSSEKGKHFVNVKMDAKILRNVHAISLTKIYKFQHMIRDSLMIVL